MMPPAPNMKEPWEQWGNHVLIELEQLNAKYGKLSDDIRALSVTCSKIDALSEDMKKNSAATIDNSIEIGKLQIKAGAWGLLGGVLAGIGIALGSFLKGH